MDLKEIRCEGVEWMHLIQVVVFWVLIPWSDVVGYFTSPQDGGCMVLRNGDIVPHHYTGSQPKRPRLGSSSP
jgi:hypothetical protein